MWLSGLGSPNGSGDVGNGLEHGGVQARIGLGKSQGEGSFFYLRVLSFFL